jgi:hypothetical protein
MAELAGRQKFFFSLIKVFNKMYTQTCSLALLKNYKNVVPLHYYNNQAAAAVD